MTDGRPERAAVTGPGGDLERLARDTVDLSPEGDLGAAVLAAARRDPPALARLAAATAELDASDGFADAVAARVRARAPGTLEAVGRAGPLAVVVAALAAAAAIAFSVQTQRDVDETIVSSVLVVEEAE